MAEELVFLTERPARAGVHQSHGAIRGSGANRGYQPTAFRPPISACVPENGGVIHARDLGRDSDCVAALDGYGAMTIFPTVARPFTAKRIQ